MLGCQVSVAGGPPSPLGISAQSQDSPQGAPQAFLAIREGYKKQHFSAPECDLCDFTESREKQEITLGRPDLQAGHKREGGNSQAVAWLEFEMGMEHGAKLKTEPLDSN